MKNKFGLLSKVGSTVVVAGLAAALSAPGALAQESVQDKSLANLGACVSEKGKLDVIVLIDETKSLPFSVKDGQIDESKPGADADNNRIPAAQSFIDELLQRRADTNTETRVRIAGFGQNYKAGSEAGDYGEWEVLDEGSAQGLKDEIQAFENRTNEDYTNYANAMKGAYSDFTRSGSDNACRMLVTFTDGALTAADGADSAKTQLCTADGVTDRLRSGEVTNIGIGLSSRENPSDFSLLKGVTSGEGSEPCGQLPPNGAFFEASNVGALFAAFRKSLSTGRDIVHEDAVRKPLNFTLDDSLSAVKFSLLSQENLGPDANAYLESPSGERISLAGQAEGTVGGVGVQWASNNDSVQTVSGRMARANNAKWAGEWTLGFENFDPSTSDGRVVSIVEIQPDLKVKFSGSNSGEATANGLSLVDDEQLRMQLVDVNDQQIQLAGDGKAIVSFTEPGQQPIILATDVDLKGGEAVINLDKLPKAPTNGRLEAKTIIRTAGVEGARPSEFKPFMNAVNISVTPQNMPKLDTVIKFSTEEATGESTLAITGPGKVWIEQGAMVDAQSLPEGVGEIAVSSQYNSPDNALIVQRGETATLPIAYSIAEPTEGLVNGTTPVTIGDVAGTKEPLTMDVQTEGAYKVPLNAGVFGLAFIGALLGALLIPLGLLYLIRFLTSKIPSNPPMGAVSYPVIHDGHTIQLPNGKPEFSAATANQNPVSRSAKKVTAAGFTGCVAGFHPNPFAETPVVLESAPSIGGSGEQSKGRAKLPLSLSNSWFVVGNPTDDRLYTIVAILALGTPMAQLEELEREIDREMPTHVQTLREQFQNNTATDLQASSRSGGAKFSSLGLKGKKTPLPQSSAVPNDSTKSWREVDQGFGSNQAAPWESDANQSSPARGDSSNWRDNSDNSWENDDFGGSSPQFPKW